jgi:uncharacterized protein YecE (DUF72 family)
MFEPLTAGLETFSGLSKARKEGSRQGLPKKPRVFVGVSGFSYSGWKENFYPKSLKNEEFLGYYSQRFNSVEINSSFYAPPSAGMVKSWSAKTDDDFRFAFKAPRQITHISKLGKGAPEATQRLAGTLALLGAKRGPLLFQLPPYSKQDLRLLEEFLGKTSDINQRVFEFRHESWLEDRTYKLMEKYDAAFCIAQTEDMEPVFKVTGGLAYFRLRRDVYDEKTINQWSQKIVEMMTGAREAYVYLRHDETGENAKLALRLAESLA